MGFAFSSSHEAQSARGLARLLPAVHAQFIVDALDLSLDGIDGNDQFVSNFGIGEAGGKQAQDTPLLRAERLDQRWLSDGYSGSAGSRCLFTGRGLQQVTRVGGQLLIVDAREKSEQQFVQGWSLIEEEALVALRPGQGERPQQRLASRDCLFLRLIRQSLQNEDF